MHKAHRDSSGGELGSENYDSYQNVWVPLHPFTSPYTPGLLGENSKCSDLGMFSDKDIFCLSLSHLSWTPFPLCTLSQNLNVILVPLWHIIIIYFSLSMAWLPKYSIYNPCIHSFYTCSPCPAMC